jgi:lipopolysaccharide/colanic/teichoic acid biosynthesis glycosyltransferase
MFQARGEYDIGERITGSQAMPVKVKDVLQAVRSALRPKVDGIHSDGVFKAILTHERAVSERNSHCITVLAFYATEDRIGTHTAQVLGKIFADRLRATDVAGWLDARVIGVILPNTRVKDAVLVAEQINHRLSAYGIRLPYKFYLYPHDECGKSNGQLELPLPNSFSGPFPAATEPKMARLDASPSPRPGAGPGDPGRVIGTYPVADICVPPFPVWKRCLDTVLCLLALAVFGPLMLLIALGIKTVSPGPVLFQQERIGFRGKPFVLFKFRSMRVNADTGVHKEHLAHLMQSNASLTKLDKADARLIPFGRVFRASGLDELPQLINILRGDMSFIGPRPCVPYEYEQYSHWHKRRCETYPGLTGLWQVSGKNKTTFTEMMRLDLAYGRRQTLIEDLRILVQTIPAVVGQIRDTSTGKKR